MTFDLLEWYLEGPEWVFALKIAVTIAVIILTFFWFNRDKIKKPELFKKLTNGYHLENSDDWDLRSKWDEGMERVDELKDQLKSVKDPYTRYNEMCKLLEQINISLNAMYKRRSHIDKAYNDMYREYGELRNETLAIKKHIEKGRQT